MTRFCLTGAVLLLLLLAVGGWTVAGSRWMLTGSWRRPREAARAGAPRRARAIHPAL
jgi:hypothetical protein